MARRLKQAIEDHGFVVWWQEDVQCCAEWHGTVDQAVRDAGCIVVLWSKLAVDSPWVRHEASQAIVRQVYAPVRIDMVAIPSPFNRSQATDLFEWTGDPREPGFQDLLARIDELIPQPIPWYRRWGAALVRARATIAASFVAVVALSVLAKLTADVVDLSGSMGRQTIRQEQIAADIDRSMHPLAEMTLTVFLAIDGDDPELVSYRARLRHELTGKALSNALASSQVTVARTDAQKHVLQVQIPRQSRLWPDLEDERVARFMIEFLDLRLVFPRELGSDQIALSIPLGWHPDETFAAPPPILSVDLHDMSLALQVSFTPDFSTWQSDGSIASVLDLPGRLFRLSVESVVVPREDLHDRMRTARGGIGVRTVTLRAGGREFWMRASDLTERVSPDGLRTYQAHLREDSWKRR